MDLFIIDGDLKTQNDSILSHFDIECQSTSPDAATTTSLHASTAMHNAIETTSNPIRAIDNGLSADADISRFLERKVQIAQYTWAVGADFAQNFDPWTLFFTNPAVKKKIDNYFLVKGDMKLTFYVNGTPFHAGMMLASYSYLDSTNETITIGGDVQLVTRSQRPHLYMNVSTGKSGCICVPFFFPQNYLALTSATIVSAHIGRINLDSFAALQQINGGTDTVTISVFAEMMNVKLTVPTLVEAQASVSDEDFNTFFDIEPQGDEYVENGVISGPASAVAEFAGHLVKVPFIGPLALATQIGSGAIGAIARLFGYSRPAMIGDVMPMRNFPVSSLALTEGGDTSQKLTLTGKQELSIDPRIAELDGEDTLTLKCMTQRESYVTQFDWLTTATIGDTIFAGLVTPMFEQQINVTGGTKYTPTSLSFASRPFSEWSGTLRYRFQVIASQYHRGRIAIIYDPTGPIIDEDPYNTTFNTIIDLAEVRDVTVEFKWQHENGYAAINSNKGQGQFWDTVAPKFFTAGFGDDNGLFYVKVVNELVVPDGISDVKILVSISAGDDFELANPHGDLGYTTFVPQSGNSSEDFASFFDLEPQSAVEETPMEENAPEGVLNTVDVTTNIQNIIDEKPLIYFGERCNSYRQLLKRYSFYRTIGTASNENAQKGYAFVLKAMPCQGGYDPSGPETTAAAHLYNYSNGCYITYLKGAYAGWRGSIRYKFCPANTMRNMLVTRLTGSRRDLPTTFTPSSIEFSNTLSSNALAALTYTTEPSTAAGAALTQCRSQDALEVEIPMAVPLRFCRTGNDFIASGSNNRVSGYPGGDSFSLFTTTRENDSSCFVSTYVAAGEDFTLLGWIGAPTLYSNTKPDPQL